MGENPPDGGFNDGPGKAQVFVSNVYRIPALIYNRRQRKLLAFVEKRTSTNDRSSVALVMKTGEVSREADSIQVKWSDPSFVVKKCDLVVKGKQHRPMSPCPIHDRNGVLHLFFVAVKETVLEREQARSCKNATRLFLMTSDDVGQTWSDPSDLTEQLPEIKNWSAFGVGPGHGILTENGRLLIPAHAYNRCRCRASHLCPRFCCCPLWCCSDCCVSACVCRRPHALGIFFQHTEPKLQLGDMLEEASVECQMAEVYDSTTNQNALYCNASARRGKRVEAKSLKEGKVFTKIRRKLPETSGGCHGSVISFPGHVEPESNPIKCLLFSHPTSSSKRMDLGVFMNESPLDPAGWSEPWIIHRGPSGSSDLAYLGDGWFACLMECGDTHETEQIACRVFSYEDIKKGVSKSKLRQKMSPTGNRI